METQEKMDMEQFTEKIRERMEQQGRFAEVSLHHVLKNNGIMRYGLLMRGKGNNLVPTVYLEPFFEAYEDGAGMEEITGKILESYESALCGGVDMSFFQDFSLVRDRVCMNLVNREANAGLLAEIPHREFLDMAVVYYVDFYDPRIGAGTIRLHDSHLRLWGVNEEELWEAANRNTPERKPGRVEDMEDMLAELFSGEGNGDSGCGCCNTGKAPVPMLVITNTDRVYGASVILYNGILRQAADKIGGDLFILPSSLHEVIAVPVAEGWEAAELMEMVMDVNQKQLDPEEVLSNKVYVYRREQDRLEIA